MRRILRTAATTSWDVIPAGLSITRTPEMSGPATFCVLAGDGVGIWFQIPGGSWLPMEGRGSSLASLSNLAKQFFNPRGFLGAPIDHKSDLGRTAKTQPLGDLAPDITRRRLKSAQAVFASLLVSQYGNRYARVAELRAQVNARHGHKTDPRVFEFAFDHLGNFAANLICQPVVTVSGNHCEY